MSAAVQLPGGRSVTTECLFHNSIVGDDIVERRLKLGLTDDVITALGSVR
ncbi:hypothetical protein [Mycobacterium marinum]|nr:hypothetical protein [Mycobacterium marinum]